MTAALDRLFALAEANGEGDVPPIVGLPVAPPRDLLYRYLDQAFDAHRLSNFGPLATRLEERLAEHLGVPHLLLTANGTLGLQIALKLFAVEGEVLMPAFSFAATAAAADWVGLTPRYLEIEWGSLTLDPAAVDGALAERPAGAVMPVHTYGGAADVEAFARIGAAHGLPILYDAAHAFGAVLDGRSLIAFGDAAVLSLHATKPFHTVEGGAIVLHDADRAARARRMIAFGLDRTGAAVDPGTNAKLSELHAAVGLALLDGYDAIAERRHAVVERYRQHLAGAVPILPEAPRGTGNASYMAILMPDEARLLKLMKAAEAAGVGLKRYFHPPLHLPGAAERLPVTEDVSARALCLPLHPDLAEAQVARVCAFVLAALADR